MNPPEHALVLAVDEKSQIQALDRTAPCLPVLPAFASVGVLLLRSGSSRLGR
jgi:hypothetical protein